MGESVEMFVRSLYDLAENCEFKDRNDQIRDRIVIRVRDKEVSTKLQMMSDLKLEKSIQICRSHEMIKNQMNSLQERHFDETETIHTRRRTHNNSQNCIRCGNIHTEKDICEAYGNKCTKCNFYNHFPTYCRSKTVNIDHIARQDGKRKNHEYYLGSITRTEIPTSKKDRNRRKNKRKDVLHLQKQNEILTRENATIKTKLRQIEQRQEHRRPVRHENQPGSPNDLNRRISKLQKELKGMMCAYRKLQEKLEIPPTSENCKIHKDQFAEKISCLKYCEKELQTSRVTKQSYDQDGPSENSDEVLYHNTDIPGSIEWLQNIKLGFDFRKYTDDFPGRATKPNG